MQMAKTIHIPMHDNRDVAATRRVTGGSLKAAGFGDGRIRRDLAGGNVDSSRSLSLERREGLRTPKKMAF